MSSPQSSLREEASVVFRRAMKADGLAIHRTVNRAPKGTGWVQCCNAPPGLMCRPAKLREALALYQQAYDIFPDIVALNQLALGHEMLGEFGLAVSYFRKMRDQAEIEDNPAYLAAADMGLARLSNPTASAP